MIIFFILFLTIIFFMIRIAIYRNSGFPCTWRAWRLYRFLKSYDKEVWGLKLESFRYDGIGNLELDLEEKTYIQILNIFRSTKRITVCFKLDKCDYSYNSVLWRKEADAYMSVFINDFKNFIKGKQDENI